MGYKVFLAIVVCLFAFDAKAVINGTVVDDPENSGVVLACSPYHCVSGVLLTNDWLLTSGHFRLSTSRPFTNFVFPGGDAGEPYFGDFVVVHPSLDFALMHLENPILIGGDPAGYRMGIFTGSSDSLTGMSLKVMGYGDDGYGGRGVLRETTVVATGDHDEYNFRVLYAPNHGSGGGDSGGPVFTAGKAGRVLVGINKNGMFQLPENIREWALSYMYGRPVEMPKVWFVYGNSALTGQPRYSKFWDRPLRNGFANDWTFDPCPNGLYTFQTGYDLEPGGDYIYLETDGQTYELNGWNGQVSGIGKGPFTIKVMTNQSKQSPGINGMTFSCSVNLTKPRQTAHIISPMPPPFAQYTVSIGYPPFYGSLITWDPCPDSASYTVKVGCVCADKEASTTVACQASHTAVCCSGNGERTFVRADCNQPVKIEEFAPTLSGLSFLEAVCHDDVDFIPYQPAEGLHCHGPTCLTTPVPLPDRYHEFIWWTPCDGHGFKWTASYDLGNRAD